jgi:hypothetical protein
MGKGPNHRTTTDEIQQFRKSLTNIIISRARDSNNIVRLLQKVTMFEKVQRLLRKFGPFLAF